MGLHTGQAVAERRSLHGPRRPSRRRIGAAGHGGQILVSQATQTLLEDEEEDLHVFLRDLGEQRLKDLDRPVRLYQAAADGLHDSFPPVRGDAHLAQAAEAAIAPPLVAAPVGWRSPASLALSRGRCSRPCSRCGMARAAASDGVQAEPRRAHRPADERDRRRDPGRDPPGPVAAGDGSVWVGNLDDRTLTRIDTAQRLATATVSLDERTPTGLTVGAGGVGSPTGCAGRSRASILSSIGSRTRSTSPRRSGAHRQRRRGRRLRLGGVRRLDLRADRSRGRSRRRLLVRRRAALGGGRRERRGLGGQLRRLRRPALQPWRRSSRVRCGRSASVVARPRSPLARGRSGWRTRRTTRSHESIPARARLALSESDSGRPPSPWDPVRCGSRIPPTGRSHASTRPRTSSCDTIDIGNAPYGVAVDDGIVWVAVQAP